MKNKKNILNNAVIGDYVYVKEKSFRDLYYLALYDNSIYVYNNPQDGNKEIKLIAINENSSISTNESVISINDK